MTLKSIAKYGMILIALTAFALGFTNRFFSVIPSILPSIINVLSVVLFVVVLLYFLYPIANHAFGVVLIKDGRKYRIRIPAQMNTPAGSFASSIGTLFRFAYLGFRDSSSFREELATEPPIMRKDVLTWFGVLACFSYGVVNVPFLLLFWICLSAQFNDDLNAASHVAACESLLGLFFLFMKPFHLPVSALYVVFGVVWIGFYALSDGRSLKTLLLQATKLVIFLASIFIPYYLNHRDAFHF